MHAYQYSSGEVRLILAAPHRDGTFHLFDSQYDPYEEKYIYPIRGDMIWARTELFNVSDKRPGETAEAMIPIPGTFKFKRVSWDQFSREFAYDRIKL